MVFIKFYGLFSSGVLGGWDFFMLVNIFNLVSNFSGLLGDCLYFGVVYGVLF